jgi:hypothetical protein
MGIPCLTKAGLAQGDVMSSIRLLQRVICFSITVVGNLATCPALAEVPAHIELCLDQPAINQLTHRVVMARDESVASACFTYKT